MITIIHGDNIANSRNYLLELKKKSNNKEIFVGDNYSLINLVQAIESNILFEVSNKEVFIEDLFTKKRSPKEIKEITLYLQKHSQNISLTLWESKNLSKKQLSIFPKSIVKTFNLPKSLFLFLESLKPGNGKNLIFLFHATSENIGVELVFYMLTRQIRLLLGVSDKAQSSQIDELKFLAPWQLNKLQKQSSFFSENSLKNIYNEMYKIDISQKTGTSVLCLLRAIDFLLLSI